MTTLDRAFVRAFQRRGPLVGTTTSETAARGADSGSRGGPAALPEATAATAATAGDVLSALQHGPPRIVGERRAWGPTQAVDGQGVAARPAGVRIRVDRAVTCAAPTLDQLGAPVAAAAQPSAPQRPSAWTPQATAPKEPAANLAPLGEAPPRQTAVQEISSAAMVVAETPAPVVAAAASAAIHIELPPPVDETPAPNTVEDAQMHASDESPEAAEQDELHEETAQLEPQEGPTNAAWDDVAAPDEPPRLHPQLQVDAFWWPDVCTRLEQLAGSQIDQLADELVGAGPRRRRVAAVAGAQAGVGCSTLAICLARRLALGGLKVALVDADLESPALADSLGLAIEAGWEQTLDGRGRLEDVLVESLADGVALLPRQEPLQLDALAALRMEDHVNRLREHYDVTILDWGSLDASQGEERVAFRQQATHPDVVLLMHDARTTSVEDLERLAERLETSAVAMVENFATT